MSDRRDRPAGSLKAAVMNGRQNFLSTILATAVACGVTSAQESAAPASAQVTAHPGDAFSPSGPWLGQLDIPEVVRFRELPQRMYLEPVLFPPQILTSQDDRLVPHFERVLREATDAEIQEIAALSLARVAREKLGDISSAAETLKSIVQDTKDENVRHACAFALAEGNVEDSADNLLQIAAAGSDAERVVIEAALARWKCVSAGDLWRARLAVPFETVVSLRLACEGLVALDDQQSVTALTTVLLDTSLEYAKRNAAARAICRLSPAAAIAEAAKLIEGSIPDRLLVVTLLDHAKKESHLQTERLCEDTSDAVAAAAWLQLFRQSRENLIGHLPSGKVHRDAAIRVTAGQVMRLFPTEERASWLNDMLSDRHIDVRNTARRMLVLTAGEVPDLSSGIVGRAAEGLRSESNVWQGIEQSLILLGQLQETQFSVECVPLLDHARSEVMVSAAWLIHLYPDPAIKDPVLLHAVKVEKQLIEGKVSRDDRSQKLGMLLQYCGVLKCTEVQPILERQYSKAAPDGRDMRAAAMWTVGLLNERNPDPVVIEKLTGRINDRNPMNPERIQVRRMSVLALGLMRAKDSIPVLQNAFRIDLPDTLIPGMVRWVFPLLGEHMPDDYPPITVQAVGDWKLMPAGNRP